VTPALGRRLNHDPRNRAYGVAARLDAPAPLRTVMHNRHVPIYDQGRLGSCVANAVCGALSTGPGTARIRSERYIVGVYRWLTAHDPFDGTWPPTDTGSDATTGGAWAVATGRIAEYRHAFTLAEALAALQERPVLFGLGWYESMFDPLSDGRLAVTGSVVGGHEVILDGIDVDAGRVWLTNSWGPAWGVTGRAYLSVDDFDRLRADQGDVTVLYPGK